MVAYNWFEHFTHHTVQIISWRQQLDLLEKQLNVSTLLSSYYELGTRESVGLLVTDLDPVH